MKKALITGITGQDGAYLAKLLIQKGYKVYGSLRDCSVSKTKGLEYLGIQDDVQLITVDLLNYQEVETLIKEIKPTEIYNLAAQSSVAASFKNPNETLQFNVQSVLNLLEAIRTVNKDIHMYQASSSEMFGKVDKLPINEKTQLNPLSPYAASKAAAHLLVENYRVHYGLFVVSGILFNHESYLRGENFFMKKIIRDSILVSEGKKEVLSVGNIEVRRDFGYGPKYVEAMWKMLQNDKPKDYIICSGESVLLKDIVLYVFNKFNIPESKLVVDPQFYRPNDIEDIYGDSSKTKEELGWDYDMSFYDVLDILIDEELKAYRECNDENIV